MKKFDLTQVPDQAKKIIDALKLVPHPEEGGYFIETYRDNKTWSTTGSTSYASGAERNIATAIYYLLTPDTFSEMHILPSTEVFHFYLGDPVEMVNLWPDGTATRVILGPNIEEGQKPQHVVPGGVWQGSRLLGPGSFALLGCTVSPGFDFADYTPGQAAQLTQEYPGQAALIAALCRR